MIETNKLKEIVGGSWIIRDVFKDYLYPIARDYSQKLYGEKGKGIFSYIGNDGDIIYEFSNPWCHNFNT